MGLVKGEVVRKWRKICEVKGEGSEIKVDGGK